MTTVLPRRHPDIEVAEFDTEFVVFDPSVGQVHRIAGLEAAVFDACDGVTTVDALVDELELEGPAEVTSSLERFRQLGLLEGTVAEPPPPCYGCQGLVDPPPATTWRLRLRRWWSARR